MITIWVQMNTQLFKGQKDSLWLPVEVATADFNARLIWSYPLMQPQVQINSPLINVSVETQSLSPGVSLPKSILNEKVCENTLKLDWV